MGRDTAPLAPHAGHTLGRPTGLLTGHTLGVGWQVPLPPVVVLHNILLADTIIVRCVGSAFLTIADHKVLAVHMGVVLTQFTSDRRTVLQPLATYITELAFEDGGCGETMGHRILDQGGGYTGARRYY